MKARTCGALLTVLTLLISGCSAVQPSVTTIVMVPPPANTTPATSDPAPAVTPTESAGNVTATSPTETPPTSPTASEPPVSPIAAARSGVVRIETQTCSGYPSGTGFLYGNGDFVLTAAHVVEGAVDIRVIRGSKSYLATVRNIDTVRDVALLKLTEPAGTALPMAASDPSEQQHVTALGFTYGEAYTSKGGTVNGLNRKATLSDGTTMYGLFELDAAANGGNSGGPVVSDAGEVEGMIVAGPRYEAGGRLAVPVSVLRSAATAWVAGPSDDIPDPVGCFVVRDMNDVPLKPQPDAYIAMSEATHTLRIYYRTVNVGDAEAAVAQFAEGRDPEVLREGTRSTRTRDGKIVWWQFVDDRPIIRMTFTSTQNAGDGPRERPQETCTRWLLDYSFKTVREQWLIDKVTPFGGTGNEPCSTSTPDE